jgi:hypothetical protein
MEIMKDLRTKKEIEDQETNKVMDLKDKTSSKEDQREREKKISLESQKILKKNQKETRKESLKRSLKENQTKNMKENLKSHKIQKKEKMENMKTKRTNKKKFPLNQLSKPQLILEHLLHE